MNRSYCLRAQGQFFFKSIYCSLFKWILVFITFRFKSLSFNPQSHVCYALLGLDFLKLLSLLLLSSLLPIVVAITIVVVAITIVRYVLLSLQSLSNPQCRSPTTCSLQPTLYLSCSHSQFNLAPPLFLSLSCSNPFASLSLSNQSDYLLTFHLFFNYFSLYVKNQYS